MTGNGGVLVLSTMTGILPISGSVDYDSSSGMSSYTIRVQLEEPILLLLISRDIDESRSDY
jgi:hypothetical protein